MMLVIYQNLARNLKLKDFLQDLGLIQIQDILKR